VQFLNNTAITGTMSTNAIKKAAPSQQNKRAEAQKPEAKPVFGLPYRTQRYKNIKGYHYKDIQRARFTLSHILLAPGSTLMDNGCKDGLQTYLMAALMPEMTFIGLDQNKRFINKAKEKFQLPNLSYRVAKPNLQEFEDNTVDAIINSDILHEVYSSCRYNPRIVSETLELQLKKLKKDGLIFIRDYARPPPNEMVMLELSDTKKQSESNDDDLATMSDAKLLLWYSSHARPKQDPGCGGFFLEELPPRLPQTRLFRLPYKWAYEFLMRKDQKAEWQQELPMEYTFYTMREFRTNIRLLGMRVEYAAPHWDDDIIAEKFSKNVRLYDDNGARLDTPPTCFIAVARKMPERKSLNIEERRPSDKGESTLSIQALRNEKTGALVETVRRVTDVSEILPYRIDDDGRLKLYLHDGVPRGIANSVPRKGLNIDRKRWSGHMVESISVASDIVIEMGHLKDSSIKDNALFARDHLGLKPENNAKLMTGDSYYPAPEYIDEKIQTYYLNVQKSSKTIQPKSMIGSHERFQAKGNIHEFDAQHVLNAISVGMVPSARLELQILALFDYLNVRVDKWTDIDITDKITAAVSDTKLGKIMRMMTDREKRFRNIKGTTGSLRPIHSTFVEEGQSQGALSGLSAEDVDFVVSEERTMNTAVVVPLTKNMREEIHAGALLNHTPVPQRHTGNSKTLSMPSFDIPPHISTPSEMKAFVAEQFTVAPNMVFKLGESYFTHIGMAQHRIHPFAVAAPPGTFDDPEAFFLPINQFRAMWSHTAKSTHFMTTLARSYKYMNQSIKQQAKLEARAISKERIGDGREPDWGVPVFYDTVGEDPAITDALEAEAYVSVSTAPAAFQSATLGNKIACLKTALNSQRLSPADEVVLRQKIDQYYAQARRVESFNSNKAAAKQDSPTQAKTYEPDVGFDVALSAEFEDSFEQEIDELIETLDLRLEK
jgi:2-polyprenyl-3-methyl-5-hydroxy-6-metoxy-1,4-benzoquinol methylase